MRSEAPALLPLFRSRHQAEALTLLFLHPGQEFTLTELATRVGVPLTTAQREMSRLVESDLVRERRIGRARLLSANAENRYARPLTEMLMLTFGPHVVIAEEFALIEGATAVGIFGSWAARYGGEPGPPPRDIDVIVIGATGRGPAYQAAERAERKLTMRVNPVVVSHERWQSASDPLIQQIRSSALLWVIGDEGGLGQ
ncbi:winged helix-turn-helix domain-containing protein [Planotetraspora sp. A-T 1434]|uniref:winged helix-turn-helix domain-containing protein n=1 Tax=Planotetraspora sp. A-T 1434 TaxID=2979219 RepID=UPI0021C0A935|nr:winged helix-turn-helix domain-containing protein [Planotetraspora sp. A-T 1434]MCT9932984.1 winged helix-turn-helix domain-containing protein [Planotetraspora sp. A-T 1434]